MNEYVSLDLATEMRKYFEYIKPLLTATTERAREIGLPMAPANQTSANSDAGRKLGRKQAPTFSRAGYDMDRACFENRLDLKVAGA